MILSPSLKQLLISGSTASSQAKGTRLVQIANSQPNDGWSSRIADSARQNLRLSSSLSNPPPLRNSKWCHRPSRATQLHEQASPKSHAPQALKPESQMTGTGQASRLLAFNASTLLVITPVFRSVNSVISCSNPFPPMSIGVASGSNPFPVFVRSS